MVVSQPAGQHDAIVQYDFGKVEKDGVPGLCTHRLLDRPSVPLVLGRGYEVRTAIWGRSGTVVPWYVVSEPWSHS